MTSYMRCCNVNWYAHKTTLQFEAIIIVNRSLNVEIFKKILRALQTVYNSTQNNLQAGICKFTTLYCYNAVYLQHGGG